MDSAIAVTLATEWNLKNLLSIQSHGINAQGLENKQVEMSGTRYWFSHID